MVGARSASGLKRKRLLVSSPVECFTGTGAGRTRPEPALSDGGRVGSNRKDRLSPPLMYAFRGAHEARDAKTKLDLRDEAGERVIASRRMAVRTAITEPTLRREVARDL